jgi:membrane protein GlpM
MAAVIVRLSKRGNTLPGILPLSPTLRLSRCRSSAPRTTMPGFGKPVWPASRRFQPILPFRVSAISTVGRVDDRVALLGRLAAWLIVASGIFLALRPA